MLGLILPNLPYIFRILCIIFVFIATIIGLTGPMIEGTDDGSVDYYGIMVGQNNSNTTSTMTTLAMNSSLASFPEEELNDEGLLFSDNEFVLSVFNFKFRGIEHDIRNLKCFGLTQRLGAVGGFAITCIFLQFFLLVNSFAEICLGNTKLVNHSFFLVHISSCVLLLVSWSVGVSIYHRELCGFSPKEGGSVLSTLRLAAAAATEPTVSPSTVPTATPTIDAGNFTTTAADEATNATTSLDVYITTQPPNTTTTIIMATALVTPFDDNATDLFDSNETFLNNNVNESATTLEDEWLQDGGNVSTTTTAAAVAGRNSLHSASKNSRTQQKAFSVASAADPVASSPPPPLPSFPFFMRGEFKIAHGLALLIAAWCVQLVFVTFFKVYIVLRAKWEAEADGGDGDDGVESDLEEDNDDIGNTLKKD